MTYTTIAADPPWPYADANGDNVAMPKDPAAGRRVSDLGYPTMSIDALKALPVRDLADKNAHLYLWTTNAFMVEAHEIVKAWGFTPKTILTWGKVHQDDRTRPSMKTGYWFRGATEHIVFGVRGTLRTQVTLPTLFLWPRIGHHSVKPDAFYDMVEMASPGPYVELFARSHRFFWDVWGNESANTARMEGAA